jgi:hypothetical protein
MINWRSGRAGLVGTSKRLIVGAIKYVHTASSLLINSFGSVVCSVKFEDDFGTNIDFLDPNISIRIENSHCNNNNLKGELMKWTYDNDYDSFSLNIGSFIVNRGLLLDNLTEVVFMVKLNEEDEDVDAKATLTLSNGLTKVAGSTEADAVIEAHFYSENFGTAAMEVGIKYYIGVGIKTLQMTKFLEIRPVDNRLVLVNDFIHD